MKPQHCLPKTQRRQGCEGLLSPARSQRFLTSIKDADCDLVVGIMHRVLTTLDAVLSLT
jgi:hypothetical protein